MKYKCIIFDCDGVLVDSVTISTQVLIDLAASVGFEMDMEFAFARFSGGSLKSAFAYIEDQLNRKLPDHFEQEYRQRTFEAFKRDLQPIAGIHELLGRLSIPFCVASSGPVNKIELNLTKTGLLKYFKGKIFSSYQIQSWKPNPQIFLHAAKNMGYLPSECVVIEDSLDGIRAAKAGGFGVLGFTNNLGRQTLEKEGVPVFDDMNTLDALLS